MRRSIILAVLILPAMPLAAWVIWALWFAAPAQMVAEELDRSVLRIYVSGPAGRESGTGLVVNQAGHIATNHHVVRRHIDNGWAISVTDPGGEETGERSAELVAAFPGEDLAILRVDGLDRPPVIFANTGERPLAKGDGLYALGFPGASDRLGPLDEASLVSGSVSRVFQGPWEQGAPAIAIIQHTAPTNPGDSGGPLVDHCGHVIGINSQREARIIFGPGGIPIVVDPIQGVFYGSHVSVLIEKLETTGIAFEIAAKGCRAGAAGALDRQITYAAIFAAILFAVLGMAVIFRPRRAVHQVVAGQRPPRHRRRRWRLRTRRSTQSHEPIGPSDDAPEPPGQDREN